MTTAYAIPRRPHDAQERRIAPLARRARAPWAHHGVASERANRAEQAYTAELVHAERAALGMRTRIAAEGSAQ